MSYSLVLFHNKVVKEDGFTEKIGDIANSISALFMINVKELTGKLDLTLQCLDEASKEYFDFAKIPTIVQVGKYTYPSIEDSRFFQSIPKNFRIKYELSGECEFSIGYNAVS